MKWARKCRLLILIWLITSNVGDITKNTEILEMDGMIYVIEPTNTARIQEHLHLWAEGMRQEGDKATLLSAHQLMMEAFLLLKAVNQLQNTVVEPKNRGYNRNEIPTWDNRDNLNQLRRQKRNILGDALHFLTGVATDDELKEQVKRENELRDKITATLTRQLAFEKELTEGYATIMTEEEGLTTRVRDMEEKHKKEISEVKRNVIYRSLVQEDVDKMEDILEAVQTGICNTRHSTFLSSRAGLNKLLTFRLIEVQSTPEGPTLKYSSRMYRKVEAIHIEMQGKVTEIETADRMYLLHPAHPLTSPITEEEVRVLRGNCTDCAKFVHMGQHIYKTLKSGTVNCEDNQDSSIRRLMLQTGETFRIKQEETCQNQIYTTGLKTMRHAVYTIQTTGDDMLEALLLRKHIKNNKTFPEDQHKVKMAHEAMTLKLREDVDQADRDLTNFILDTKEQENISNTVTSPIGFWLLGLTGGLFVIIMLILKACWLRRKVGRRGRARHGIEEGEEATEESSV